MKVVFHKEFYQSDYASDAASRAGRIESIMDALIREGHYEVSEPSAAKQSDLQLAHSKTHITSVRRDKKLFRMASLAVGGAILASEFAMMGEPAFACIRPPGHHASRSSSWGYCTFNNLGIALLKLSTKKLIKSAFVLDFDAHTGDGNKDVLSHDQNIKIINPMADDNKQYVKLIETACQEIETTDVVAVSAGFDTYEKDVGKKLKTFDFYLIGRLIKQLTKRLGHQRRFAVLEGGYYVPDLGKNTLAFCQGFC